MIAAPTGVPTQPSVPRTRLDGLDLARAVAFLVMAVEHMYEVVFRPTPSVPGVPFVLTLLSGRGAATFVVVSGAGVTLLARSLGDVAGRTLVRRGAFLFLVGLALLVVWPTDILHVYGVLLLIAPLLLRLSTRTLAVVATVAAAAMVPAAFAAPHLPAFSWSAGGGQPLQVARSLAAATFVTGQNPVFPWLALFALGMLLGRLRLTDRVLLGRLAWGSAAVAVLSGVAGLAVRHVVAGSGSVDLTRAPASLLGVRYAPPGVAFIVSAAGSAVALLAVCCLLAQRRVEHAPGAVRRAAAALGRMPLSSYVLHLLLIVWVLEPLGVGRHGGPLAAVGVGVLVVAAFAVGAQWWLRRFGRGPIELVMRRVCG
ncbi:MAG: uncharacterized protein QOI42_558 [Frankiaceae bacterium]|jgi:uncharacterized membrane protein YeiB|nr:uncharacterized protein [Frankiaceae bacterium]